MQDPDPIVRDDRSITSRFWDRADLETWMAAMKMPISVKKQGNWNSQVSCEDDRAVLLQAFRERGILPNLLFRNNSSEHDDLWSDLNGGLGVETRSVTISDRLLRTYFRRVEDAVLVKLRWSHLLDNETKFNSMLADEALAAARWKRAARWRRVRWHR